MNTKVDADSKDNYQDGDASDLEEWIIKFCEDRKAQGVQPGGKGSCFVCKAESVLSCKSCLRLFKIDGRRAPFYCGKEHQLAHWKSGHKKACRNGAQPLLGLVYSVYKDYLPGLNGVEYNDYGFANCKTMTEEKNLLGLYQGLIKVLGCDLDDLDEACICMNGRLDKFIIAEYEGKMKDILSVGAYYPWFLANQHVVKNIVPTKIKKLRFNEKRITSCFNLTYRRHEWPNNVNVLESMYVNNKLIISCIIIENGIILTPHT